jgi:uncharacterized membrane protein YhaH (DUF805 family)
VVVEQWNNCKVVTLASTSTGCEPAEIVRRQSQTGKHWMIILFYLCAYVGTHTHTHTHIYIYICVCVCVFTITMHRINNIECNKKD